MKVFLAGLERIQVKSDSDHVYGVGYKGGGEKNAV
jgi:hypothetical protein